MNWWRYTTGGTSFTGFLRWNLFQPIRIPPRILESLMRPPHRYAEKLLLHVLWPPAADQLACLEAKYSLTRASRAEENMEISGVKGHRSNAWVITFWDELSQQLAL